MTKIISLNPNKRIAGKNTLAKLATEQRKSTHARVTYVRHPANLSFFPRPASNELPDLVA